MSKEQKTLKSCYILDRLREWFELYGNQNHQRAEEELHLAIDELYEYQQKDQQITDLEAKLVEKEKENNELEFIIEEIEQFAWEQLNNDNFDKYKAYDEMYTKIKQLTKNSPYEEQHQDKISFAVERLNKVKEKALHFYVNDTPKLTGFYVDVNEIDNQINQLTHQHEDK